MYDEVTDEQYKSIVGSRLDASDFIEDDDGSGYADQGVDDWDGAEDRDSESEDEDDFEGEDEELRLGQYQTLQASFCTHVLQRERPDARRRGQKSPKQMPTANLLPALVKVGRLSRTTLVFKLALRPIAQHRTQ